MIPKTQLVNRCSGISTSHDTCLAKDNCPWRRFYKTSANRHLPLGLIWDPTPLQPCTLSSRCCSSRVGVYQHGPQPVCTESRAPPFHHLDHFRRNIRMFDPVALLRVDRVINTSHADSCSKQCRNLEEWEAAVAVQSAAGPIWYTSDTVHVYSGCTRLRATAPRARTEQHVQSCRQ